MTVIVPLGNLSVLGEGYYYYYLDHGIETR